MAEIRPVLGALVLFSVLFGCERDKDGDRSAEPAASVDKAAALDPAVANAVAAASAKAQKAAPASSGGPPPTGVFAPGEADREIKKGQPPKITLGSAGSEPRVTLGPMLPKPGYKTQGALELALQNDPRQGALPIELLVTIEASKPAGAAEGGPGISLSARVKEARIATPGVPPEVAAKAAALKGARVDYELLPDGSGTGYRYEVPAAAQELKEYVRTLVDALALVTLPMPSVPLGQGAYFMTTSREGVFGLDLVSYRLVKLEALEGDRVTLSVGTRRYATSDRFELEGLGGDAPRNLQEFEAKSEGRLELKVGVPFPIGGEVNSVLAAALGAEGSPQATLQVRSRIGLSFPVAQK